MTSGGDGPPLSMRPFPVADKSPKNLSELIARVNALPGGFRAVTETNLEEEIGEAANGEDGTQDVDMSDDADDDEDEEDAEAKDPQALRAEVLRNIDVASNTAMLTLDSLSLLLSKQNPTQAGLTLSQQLRDMVGIGTMGADRLTDDDAPTAPAAKTTDRAAVALGWTLMEIDAARDAAEDATAFLAAEMAAEGRYWEGVMAVRQAGWSVCRVPREPPGTLGVRFGFSEAAPEFQRLGLAPLRRGDEDGAARLDISRLGGTQERLVVTYERGGKVVGRAAPRELTDAYGDDEDEEQDLETRVLGARNTIFAQELWHELTREARSLAAYDVRAEGEKRLVCAVAGDDDGDDARIVVELLPVSACQSPEAPDEPLPEDVTAQAISLALHILLTYAHRCGEMLRTRPFPPHVPRARGQQQMVHTLLRPVVARLTYARAATSCTRLVGSLVRTLRSAGLSSASFTLRTPQPTLAAELPPGTPAAVALVRAMLQPTDFALEVALLPGVDFAVRGRTYLVPVTATYYHVLAPADATIHALCAPYADGYPDVAALADYLGTLAGRALAAHHMARLGGGTAGLDGPPRQLDFAVACGKGGARQPLQLTVRSARPSSSGGARSWTWTPDAETSAKETLEAVVDNVLKR
ncbi:Mediator complex, subunit Med17 [Cordyceps fumosorosea ARSEF 2679]|uniref:Mediator of RNA polymerase II transcription subunit 17 n=1 Tax=Cordyceps fumosorosea (strain ARSEF 2679) TaxID=1081104 RepID=A0A167NF15_CORFA|nr:Mediator complex, subunit Med17 [Cordyceps fumosorosea ARSEF 2679]OAA55489.1 Mediator complex, subunit Med17 [Cordyceps fumosorosea ARSEF 2679]